MKWKCHCCRRVNRRCWNVLPDKVVIISLVLALCCPSARTELWQKACSTYWMSTGSALTSPLSITCHWCPSLLCLWTHYSGTGTWQSYFTDGAEQEQEKGSLCKHCPKGQNRVTALTLSCCWVLNVRVFFFWPLSKLNTVRVRMCFGVWPHLCALDNKFWKKFKLYMFY